MPYKNKQAEEKNKLRRKNDPVLDVRDKLHNVWYSMRKRCKCKTHYAYHSYGGRGISICDEWDNFENFYEWALKNGYSIGLTLDRVNNDGDYCPENCCWSSWKIQGNNRRTNTLITFNGKTQTLALWADEIGISEAALWNRLYKFNWSIEFALTVPKGIINKHNRKEFFKKWQQQSYTEHPVEARR